MFNSIFKENFQGRKHPGSCAFAEPELLSYRKPKCVVQNEKKSIRSYVKMVMISQSITANTFPRVKWYGICDKSLMVCGSLFMIKM